MVFQQRNGRIDRYGRMREPLITYLLTESKNPRMKGDLRILELLTEKDEQVVRNIGDESQREHLSGIRACAQQEKPSPDPSVVRNALAGSRIRGSAGPG